MEETNEDETLCDASRNQFATCMHCKIAACIAAAVTSQESLARVLGWSVCRLGSIQMND